MRPATHILHIFPTFNVGGSQVRFAHIADTLGSDYFHSILALDSNYGAASLLRDSVHKSLMTAPPRGRYLAGFNHSLATLRTTKPDLLVTYNWGAIEWAMSNLLAGAPHIHIEDGFGPDEAGRQFRRRAWTRRIVLQRQMVVVPSTTLQTIALTNWKLAPDRVHYVANGIPPRDNFRADLAGLCPDLPPHKPRIVWAGALRAEKNPHRLLRAFAPLRGSAILILIGDGPERTALEESVRAFGLSSDVRFLGPRTDARDIIMQCDILALSSDTEQMPLVVLEGMDAGLPIASVAVGDVPSMVSPENRRFIVPAFDRNLTAALAELIASPSLRKDIGEKNRVRARHTFGFERMCAQYGSLFQRMSAAGSAHCNV